MGPHFMTAWHLLSVHERDKITREYIAQGEAAYVAGGKLAECPYRADKQEAIWWRRGFGNAVMGAQIANQG